MKGNISRYSHLPAKRYSAVLQTQGAMVTDADLGEQAIIARSRTDGLGRDTVAGGVPATGGAVSLAGDSVAGLVEGVVYAEGVRGRTMASEDFALPMGLYDVQVDFPMAPENAGGDQVVYVDIWERTVSHLEEPLLTDPGLHGAETAFRSRTMTQVKLAPLEDLDAIREGSGRFPRIGTGRLGVSAVDPETIADPCDPCADVVTAEQSVGNTLFRIEILQVSGDADDPDSIVVAWSAENGSAIAPASVNPEDFERAGAVYEFFSPVTESYLGVHADSAAARVSTFTHDLDVDPPEAEAPEGGDWPFVRRWDGIATIDLGSGNVTRVGTAPAPGFAGGVLTITLDAFAASVDFSEASVIAGDYWLIETRRFAEEPIRPVQELPIGIRHHYCPLFRLNGETPEPLTDAERRALSFPALSDLPARQVGFENNCPKLFEDAENVQEALDNLCAISAEDIAFDPSDCPRLFDSTDNVQDALTNLCRVDFGNERLLRYLHDWGVICGVIPSFGGRQPPEVILSAGEILDRAGRMGHVDEQAVDLNKILGTEFFLFKTLDNFASEFAEQGVCLALAIGEGGVIERYLVPKSRAFLPAEPNVMTVLQQCLQEKPLFDFKRDLSDRPNSEQVAIGKVYYGAANEKLAGAQRLNGQEYAAARAFNDDLVDKYRAHIADEEEVALFDARLKQLQGEYDIDNATGAVRETRRLQFEAARYRLVQETDQERWQRCLCNALLPRCPVPGDRPYLVPVACLKGFVEGGEVFLRSVCAYECRKQAMSWRMVQYYIATLRDTLAGRLTEACCATAVPPQGGGITHVPPNLGLAQAVPMAAATQPNYFASRLDRSFDILTGQQSPTDVQVKPEVGSLALDQAERVLKGNGIEVAETIELSDQSAVQKLRDRSVGIDAGSLVFDGGALRPGDKVALLMQDGVAVDYVKLEEGAGKFLFEAAVPVAPSKPGSGFERPQAPDSGAVAVDPGIFKEAEAAARDLEARLAAITEQTRNAESDLDAVAEKRASLTEEVAEQSRLLGELESRKATLETEVAAATGTLATLREERLALTGEVEAAGEQLAAIRTESAAMETGVLAAREELEKLKEAQDRTLAETRDASAELLAATRRSMPVTTAIKDNDALVAALADRKITTIGGLAEMTDDQMREIATESRTNIRSVNKLRTDAGSLISTPIR